MSSETTILLYSFNAFKDFDENPSRQAVSRVEEQLSGMNVHVVRPSTEYANTDTLQAAIDEYEPDLVLGIGTGSERVHVEAVALNIAHSSEPDNADETKKHEQIVADAPLALESTLNYQELANYLQGKDLPAAVSYHAGTYVCNYMHFNVLWYLQQRGKETEAGFIHIPLHPDEINRQDVEQASFPPGQIADGVASYLKEQYSRSTERS